MIGKQILYRGLILMICPVIFFALVSETGAYLYPGNNIQDQDNDGMSDDWENRVGLNPVENDAQEDPDNDGLSNIEEFNCGSHPFLPDTDADELNDGKEISLETNPINEDTDSDGKSDKYEVDNGTNPRCPRNEDSDYLIEIIELKTGWNLISLPISPVDKSIEKALASISGKYALIWSYENEKWRMYDPANPGLSDLTTLDAGWGYWINMYESGKLIISGSISVNTTELISGWNLIGYNRRDSLEINKALSDIKGICLSVWTFIDGVWQMYDPSKPEFSDLTTLKPGYGYWLNMSQSFTLVWQ